MILQHVALTCSSEEKADKFYQDLLGLQKSEPKIIPPALSKALFDINSELKIINYLDENLHFEIFFSDQNSGLAAFLGTNLLLFIIATQIYGDLFVLLLLGCFLGFADAIAQVILQGGKPRPVVSTREQYINNRSTSMPRY